MLDHSADDAGELEPELTALVASKSDPLVVINADKSVRYESVVKVLDAARTSGAKKYALSTEVEINRK